MTTAWCCLRLWPPIQVVIVPVAQHKPGVLEKAEELRQKLSAFCRVKSDVSDNSPGWKYAEYEMKGVPLRLEIGPRDIEAGQCVLVRRDNREKVVVKLDELETKIPELLQAVHDGARPPEPQEPHLHRHHL